MGISDVDLVVVGAGAAGLGATRTARELGLRTVTFEAMARTGGRAFTESDSLGVPWDHGCHWLHSASINPFRRLADRYGFGYATASPPWRAFLDGRWSEAGEAAEIEAYLSESVQAVAAAADASRDIPVSQVVDRDSSWYPVYRWSINAEWGVDPDHVSTTDVARYLDTDEDWPVTNGYGALVQRHAAGLDVEIGCAVRKIDWSRSPLRVASDLGIVEAGAVLVTVSSTALASSVVSFEPALPIWKQEAFAAVPLGSANKVGLRIDKERLGVDRPTSVLVEFGADRGMSFELRPFDRDLADAYLAGPLAAELEREGPQATVAAAVDGLKALLGSGIERWVERSVSTAWGREPWIQGAYTAARPGNADRRHDLAAPLDDRLFFAGEATHPSFYSTAHGAHMSGVMSAVATAKALGRL